MKNEELSPEQADDLLRSQGLTAALTDEDDPLLWAYALSKGIEATKDGSGIHFEWPLSFGIASSVREEMRREIPSSLNPFEVWIYHPGEEEAVRREPMSTLVPLLQTDPARFMEQYRKYPPLCLEIFVERPSNVASDAFVSVEVRRHACNAIRQVLRFRRTEKRWELHETGGISYT